MIELIFLISAIITLFRRAKLKNIDRQQYSHVPDYLFEKWKARNIEAQNKTVLSAGCYIVCAIIIVVNAKRLEGIAMVLYILNLLWWVGYQGHFHGKIKRMSKKLNIVWP